MDKLRVLFSALIIFMVAFTTLAQAEVGEGWGVGLRAGGSVFTQDVADDTQGDIGPVVSGNILYRFSQIASAGLNVEWENHGFDTSGADLGDINTISLMPFAEFHLPLTNSLSPYGFLGVGVNINSVSESDVFQNACISTFGSSCDFETDTTIAFKVGAGVDFFITEALALNAEIGWKMNEGDVDIKAAGTTVASDDFQGSVFQFLLGLRYFFGT
jgi:opacity protein-like surface antigen